MFGVNMLKVILPMPYRAKADVSVADLTCLLCVMRIYIKMGYGYYLIMKMKMPQFVQSVTHMTAQMRSLSVLLCGHIARCTSRGIWTEPIS